MNMNLNRTASSINQYVRPTRAPEAAGAAGTREQTVRSAGAGSFASVLEQKLQETTAVKFSRHAEQRLADRNIQLDEAQVERLEKAVDLAAGKGVKDALVMLDDVAMVVSARNRTVITAMNQDEMQENVITNIDGAVIA